MFLFDFNLVCVSNLDRFGKYFLWKILEAHLKFFCNLGKRQLKDFKDFSQLVNLARKKEVINLPAFASWKISSERKEVMFRW